MGLRLGCVLWLVPPSPQLLDPFQSLGSILGVLQASARLRIQEAIAGYFRQEVSAVMRRVRSNSGNPDPLKSFATQTAITRSVPSPKARDHRHGRHPDNSTIGSE